MCNTLAPPKSQNNHSWFVLIAEYSIYQHGTWQNRIIQTKLTKQHKKANIWNLGKICIIILLEPLFRRKALCYGDKVLHT